MNAGSGFGLLLELCFEVWMKFWGLSNCSSLDWSENLEGFAGIKSVCELSRLCLSGGSSPFT